GHIIKFKQVTKSWFDVEIFHNGKYVRGYISKADVELLDYSAPVSQGIPVRDKIHAYSTLSKDSTVLRTYERGHIIRYKKITSNWYDLEIYHNGKYVRAYVHHDDVEIMNTTSPVLRGVVMKKPTNVYSSLSKTSDVIRTYNPGHILTYKQVTSQWLDITINVNGVLSKGYVSVDDVEKFINSTVVQEGIAINEPTYVYSQLSNQSSKLRQYPK